jgi:PAS domain S-box-containing protein
VVLREALAAACTLLGARGAALLVLRDDGVRCAARHNLSTAAVRRLTAMLAVPAAVRSLATGRSLRLSPAESAKPAARSGGDAGSALVVPVPHAGAPPALLLLLFAGDTPPAHRRAARRLAALVGAVLARPSPPAAAGLTAGCTGPAEEPEARGRLARALADVWAATAAAGDVAQAGRAAARVVRAALPGVDFVHAWLVSDDERRFLRVAVGGEEPEEPAPVELPVDREVGLARVLRAGRPVIWGVGGRRWPARLRAYARAVGAATVAQVPMFGAGRVVGLLSLFSRRPRPYTGEELAFLMTVAGQLGGQLDAVRTRARAEEERRRLRLVIDVLPEGVMIVDRRGRMQVANQAATRILGLTLTAEGQPMQRASQYHLRPAAGRTFRSADEYILRALAGGAVQGAEMVMRRPDGSEVPVRVSAAPLRTPEGELDGCVVVLQDISALKEVERLKDQFINMVSHELRTPTTTIRGGALTLLRRGDYLDAETRRQLLQDVADESERLHHLVEDLLTLSRAEAGMHITPEPLRLHRLVNKVVLDLGARLAGCQLTVDVPRDLPLVEADPLALEQVLRNLLENAARHSRPGARVEITAAASEREVVVSVLDGGPGLDPEDLERVFEPFYRSQAAIRAGVPGAGLGLAVCRRLVELQGGRIWAERRPGGGAAFRFTLPRAPEAVE